jgi:hypothetical protein
MAMRAISTVVDTTLFLLLLGGAAATLVVGTAGVGPPPSVGSAADETATLLATTTATVDYELTPTNTDSDGISYDGRAGQFDRTAHGTTAGLLATATRTGAQVDGERLVPASGGFERAVRNETRRTVSGRETAVSVTAVWEPYADAPMSHRIHVGPEPPAIADVHAARLTVDSGVESVDDRVRAAARSDGFDGVAHVVAAAVVEGFFPPDETRVALRGDSPTDTLTAHRYRRVARLVNAPLLDLRNGSVAPANRHLTDALADRFAADMRERFESPQAAARAVSVGEVRIAVRTWSP